MKNHYLNSSIITIIAILFVLFITAGCSVLLEKQNQIIEQPIITDNTLDTATWQTYRNEQYGFEFEYPSLWYLKLINNGVYLAPSLQPELQIPIEGGITIFVINYKNQKESASSLPVWFTYETLRTVSTKNGEVVVQTRAPGSEQYLAYIVQGDYKATLYFGFRLDRKYDDIFNQILSTFKFIEPSLTSIIDIPTWKTYRNEEYGFELKYPTKFLDCGPGGWGSALMSVRVCEQEFVDNELWQPSLNFGVIDRIGLSVDNFIMKEIEGDISAEEKDSVPPMPTVKERVSLSPIDNHEAYRITWDNFYDYTRGIIYIFQDSYVYGVSWFGSKEYEAIVDEIARDIKFFDK
ncbi:MAG: hypothetical protein WC575_02585 [Patescibacteria group bacterium]